MTHRVVLYSGGLNSWWVGREVARNSLSHDRVTLLFTDTAVEDPDVYRFLWESMAEILRERPAADVVWLKDGRTPWEVFRDVRMIGNTRIDPCSRILKREPTRRWIKENCDPSDTVVYIGFGWDEEHRLKRARKHWKPWNIAAPLVNPPYHTKQDLVALAGEVGVLPPDMYSRGYPHANCGGFCVKAGQAHFAHLLKENRDLYLHHEQKEEEMRTHLDADVSILKDRRGGDTKPLTLRALRERIDAGKGRQVDMFDWGGCGCFIGDEP